MSQRARNPRDRARNTAHENGEETALWNEIQEKVSKLAALEAKSKEISQKIFDTEDMFKTREKSEGISKLSAVGRDSRTYFHRTLSSRDSAIG